MYSIVSTAIVRGIESIPIRVEADVTDGMPVFEMVGFLSAEVREARERVRTALKNCGNRLPPKRITINLSMPRTIAVDTILYIKFHLSVLQLFCFL